VTVPLLCNCLRSPRCLDSISNIRLCSHSCDLFSLRIPSFFSFTPCGLSKMIPHSCYCAVCVRTQSFPWQAVLPVSPVKSSIFLNQAPAPSPKLFYTNEIKYHSLSFRPSIFFRVDTIAARSSLLHRWMVAFFTVQEWT